MLSLKLKRGISHMVDRATIFDSAYTSELPQILQEYPFRIKYLDEKAVDVGGVSRDIFLHSLKKLTPSYSMVDRC